MISAGKASRRKTHTGSREVIHISGSPTATQIACFCTIENTEPDARNDSTLDAESTITRPRPTSNRPAVSTR